MPTNSQPSQKPSFELKADMYATGLAGTVRDHDEKTYRNLVSESSADIRRFDDFIDFVKLMEEDTAFYLSRSTVYMIGSGLNIGRRW